MAKNDVRRTPVADPPPLSNPWGTLLAALALWLEWRWFAGLIPVAYGVATMALTVAFYELFRWLRRYFQRNPDSIQLGGRWACAMPLPVYVVIVGFSSVIFAMMVVIYVSDVVGVPFL